MVATVLSNNLNKKVKILSFSDKLKKVAVELFGIDILHFTRRDLKEKEIPFWGMSPRQMMQKLGTDACRNGLGDNIWIRVMEMEITKHNVDVIIIPDIRFDNEAEFVKESNGFVFELRREGLVEIKNNEHKSEQGIDNELVDWTIMNMNNNPFQAASMVMTALLKQFDLMENSNE